MSSLLTVEEIASSLGLNDNSYRQRVQRYLEMRPSSSSATSSSIQAMQRTVDELSSMTKVERRWLLSPRDASTASIENELVHLYLPQLLEAHRLAASVRFTNPWTTSLSKAARASTFGRFARSLDGKAFLEDFCTFMWSHLAGIDSLLDGIDSENYRLFTPMYCSLVALLVVAQSNSQPSFASQSAVLLRYRITTLHRHIGQTRKQYSHNQTMLRQMEDVQIAFQDLKGALTKLTAEELAAFDHPWYQCQGISFGQCTTLEKGVEMSVCGKCCSVRYCSVGHQKLHWKTHKKTCWEPIW